MWAEPLEVGKAKETSFSVETPEKKKTCTTDVLVFTH